MNKKGFTLIELLAVIIILGILMIIAIPSVTSYIDNSRKSAYVNTAKQVANAAKNLVNSGELEMYDTNVTYYIDNSCIRVENGEKAKSPYGEFNKAYVVITFDGKGYTYYWTSVDDVGLGVKRIVRIDKLKEEDIESDIKNSDISPTVGIDKRENIIVIDKSNNCGKGNSNPATKKVSGETGEEIIIVCQRATTLHKEQCTRTDTYGCKDNNRYALNEMIEYGNLGTKGVLKPGDAFDCDVNEDGVFNSANERFYYLKTENDGNTDISSLVFYTHVFNGNPTNSSNNKYAYATLNDIKVTDSSISQVDNYHGPITGYKQLPSSGSSGQWKNSRLINPISKNKNILNEIGTSFVDNGNIRIKEFYYDNRAARLLTYNDLIAACGDNVRLSPGGVDSCIFILENTLYAKSPMAVEGIWLETPNSSNTNKVWMINSYHRYVTDTIPTTLQAIKPVIEVKKIDIDY